MSNLKVLYLLMDYHFRIFGVDIRMQGVESFGRF